MLISRLVAAAAGRRWSDVYISCCNIVPGNDCWSSCGGCCCSDLDFPHLRSSLGKHAHAAFQSDNINSQTLLRMPEVFIAGRHALNHCFGDYASWQTSEDPLGVLSIQLFYLTIELNNALKEGTPLSQADGEVLQRGAQFTWARVQRVLDTTPLQEIYNSRWPLFLLAGFLGGIVNGAPAADAERARLQEETGPDGQLFRILWSRVKNSSSAAIANWHTALPEIVAHVSTSLRPVAQLAAAALQVSKGCSTSTDSDDAGLPGVATCFLVAVAMLEKACS
ncbi:unnamed protein product [Polarella glacialis]|uniref:Uncharacterized protein n=1 Tax=Polarella glacialis TaxID=89957 RepID=A0A813ESM1_POLGL|nr:unnamed protein product [Polarella glacialis]